MKLLLFWGYVGMLLLTMVQAQDLASSRTDAAIAVQGQVRQDATLSLSSSSASGGENMCGDAIVRNGEQCDDGNYENGDGCDSNCKIESTEMAINEKGLPGNSCPKGCRWNRRVHDCRCAAGVQQQAREAASGSGTKKEYVGHVSLMKREMATSPKKKMTLIIEDEDIDSSIVSPRDPASGQASGKRSAVGTGIGPDMEPDMDLLETMVGPCKPPYLCDFLEISRDRDEDASQKSKEDVYVWKISEGKKKYSQTEDTGSGSVLAKEKPKFKNLSGEIIVLEPVPEDDDIRLEVRKGRDGTITGSPTKASDDHNSSRSNKTASRDAASGLPTGKRQHKPYRLILQDGNCEEDESCDKEIIIEADLDGDGTWEASISLNGLPPQTPFFIVHRSKHDTAKNSISNVR